MRTKFTIILVSIAALVLTASPALANGRQPAPVRTPMRANIIQWAKDLRSKMFHEGPASHSENFASKSQEFKKPMQDRITEARKTQLKNWWTRASDRLNNIIGRLSKVADKISARLDKLAAAGHDVTAQRTDLTAARVKITVATQSVASASAQIDSVLTNNTPADALKKLHNLQSGVIAKIRDAHRALVALLVSIRNVAP